MTGIHPKLSLHHALAQEMRQPYLIPLLMELLAWLKNNAPSLAELYEGAVVTNELNQGSWKGEVRFACHPSDRN